MAKNPRGLPRIFEASLGPNGAVRRGHEISQDEAIEIRKAGGEVVVTGGELKSNRVLARMIEQTASGSYQQHNPHDRAGSLALPHFQPILKRRVVAPIDQVMRFFTPKLFLQANSLDDEVADRADRAWEVAIKKYTKHLNAIDSKLHADVRRLSKICLHDAELLGFETNVPYPLPLPGFEPPYRPLVPHMDSAVLFLRDTNSNQLLIYSLSDEVDLTPTDNWPFPKRQKLWLYDEVDLDERGRYVHRVLFNDGCVVKIPFWSVVVKVSPKEQVVETVAAHSN